MHRNTGLLHLKTPPRALVDVLWRMNYGVVINKLTSTCFVEVGFFQKGFGTPIKPTEVEIHRSNIWKRVTNGWDGKGLVVGQWRLSFWSQWWLGRKFFVEVAIDNCCCCFSRISYLYIPRRNFAESAQVTLRNA